MAGDSFFGRFLDRIRTRRVSPTEMIGTGGTAVIGGYPQEKERSPDLIGRAKFLTYSDFLANISVVATGTRYFLNLIAKASWTVEPVDSSAQALEWAQRFEKILDEMETPVARVARRAAMYRFYGYSIQEWAAMRNEDGTIGVADVQPRPQVTIERWDVDEQCNVLGVFQRSPQTNEDIYLPRTKIIYIVDDTLNDSPEGLGLFRHIVRASKRLKAFEDLEEQGFETDLRGVPVGRGPFTRLRQLEKTNAITKADRIAIERPMRDFVENHNKKARKPQGLLIDSERFRSQDAARTPSNAPQWEIDLMRSGASNQAEVHTAIERLNHEIARVLSIEGLLLGGDGRGSLALSRDKSNNLFLVVDSALSEITDSFTKDLVRPIWALNGWPPEFRPKIKHQPVQFRDIEQITTALRDMAQAGAVLAPDDPAINDIRELLGLSMASVDEGEPEPDDELNRATDEIIDGLEEDE